MRSSRARAHRAMAVAIAMIVIAGCAKPRPAVPTAPPPDPVRQLRTDLNTLIDQPGHQHGVWGIVVHSLARNERLVERNPRTLLVPASTMKLVTLAASAEAVGWDYVFETKMIATGPVIGGVLKGDLAIVGSGDPSVLGRSGADAIGPWLDALRARGITRIEGRIVADDDAREEPRPGFAWSWEDLGYTYGAIPGALNLAENKLEILVSPATLEGLPVTIELPAEARDLPVLNAARTGAAGSRTNLWPEFRPGQPILTVNGTIAVGEKPFAMSVAVGNPTEWF